MCGLIGIVSDTEIVCTSFNSLRDSLSHRGPDDEGDWVSNDKRVRLGHRRLSILDLKDSGHQPMVSECGRYVIVFNGEVYNYIELRKELISLGHTFTSSGDTEVVLTAYRYWGDSCLERFNGMFSLAIWDCGNANIKSSLFIARDRVGKKPLYYAKQGNAIAFASELKAIPKQMRGELDLEALNFYLALGYIPRQYCIAENVLKLPPAHTARFYPDTEELKICEWWQLPVNSPNESISTDELRDKSEELLTDSVRLRMRSDVPVGVLLSGGLDSSLVVACAAQVSEKPVKTFTIGLPGSKLDETSYAKIVANHFGTDHHVLNIAEPSLSILDEIAPFVDEPIADSSIIPAYLVSQLTSNHVKVALGGDGGDELFGGYSDYTTAISDNAKFGQLPSWLFKFSASIASKLPTGVRGRNRVAALRGGPFESLIWGSPYFDIDARRRIFSKDALNKLGDSIAAPEKFLLTLFNSGTDPVDCMTRTHFGSILPDDFLVKVDRMSMASSLELRSPLLDVRLIDYAFGSIPSDLKVQRNDGRLLQKKIGKKLLPPTLDIQRKQGFSVPMGQWLRGTNKDWHDGLVKTKLPHWINSLEVSKLIKGHEKGRANDSRLFSLIMLSISVKNIFT